MMTIEYKILFEVRFLHDYYLMDKSEKSFFALNPNEQRLLIQKKLRTINYDIYKNIEVSLSTYEQNLFKNFRLKLIKTPLGFYIGIEVKSEVTENGIIRYRPTIGQAQNVELTFGLSLVNPMFGSITNLRLSNDSEKIYYFSNQEEHIENTLSRPVEILQAGQNYRMGDLVLIGNKVHEALEDNDGIEEKWQPIIGQGFVHQADLSLSTNEGWYKDWLLNFSSRPVKPFGLIKIFFRTENQLLSPIDDDGYLATQLETGQLRPTHPVYELRFLSRATYWRYKKVDGFTAEEVSHINANASEILTFITDNFETKKPRYLAKELPPLGTHSFRLPKAQPYSIKAESGRLYSDIYFNEVNPIPPIP